jgi:arginyl-tRNA synthetase
MTSLVSKLSVLVGEAFDALDLPSDLGLVRVSDRPDLCQFQCNGAMAAAKIAKKNPREVAQGVIDVLAQKPEFAKVEIAGPGFINLDIVPDVMADALKAQSGDDALGLGKPGGGQTVMLDYGGPNIAKPMHVGHLRSSIIGDSLRRMYVFAGYNAIGDVHMGDWGLPMGMIISDLERDGRLGDDLTMEDLEIIYPKASTACKEDEDLMDAARAATAKLQDGDEAYRAVWRKFIDVSIAGMKANFDGLGVHFDLWKGEADAHSFIAPMVEQLKTDGHAVDSDGALVFHVAEDGDKKEMPPVILYKRDGAVMYGTTDMATLVDRVENYNPARIVYVVDQRQALHFEQVFRASYKSGIVPEGVPLVHAGFGTMNGTDGKPFKTRAGGVMKLGDLIQTGLDKARARLDEANLATDMDADERKDVAKKVALAAIKFADLQNNRIADYMFDLDRMVSFEGKTGPYLLYQAVRIQSLLRKAVFDTKSADAAFDLRDEDTSLALLLCQWPEYFNAALEQDTPHIIADYAYKIAQGFSSFYGNCHIMSESDEGLKQSRLALCALTLKHLETALDLLGIQIPQRM